MEQYLQLLKDIKEKGTHKPAARANMPGTTSLFGYQARHNLADGFPALTTKKLYWKGVTSELLWFLRGDTNIKFLDDRGVRKMWHEDAYNYYCKLCPQWHLSPVSFDEFLEKVKNRDKIYSYTFGDCGEQYGIQLRNFSKYPRYIIQPKPVLPNGYIATKLGIANGNGSSGQLRHTWEQMIERCYNPASSGFYAYGARGVSVCSDWLVFRNFERDVVEVEGWDDKKEDWKNYHLDKDFKGNGFIYSKETCRWITVEHNNSSSDTVFVFEKEGTRYETNNIRKLAREHNVDHANLVRVASGERKTAYGFSLVDIIDLNKGVDQISELILNLRNTPESRRHVLTAWNPRSLNNLALHACHAMFQFNCRPISDHKRKIIYESKYGQDDALNSGNWNILDEVSIPHYYLDCQLYQRSADVFLGVPLNIASYALLTEILCKICNMVPGEFIHTFGDVHIYDNHKEAVDLQLSRESKPLPELRFSLDFMHALEDYKNHGDFDKFIHSIDFDDFDLNKYDPHPSIKADLSTGLIK